MMGLVLLVEDESKIALLTSMMLEREGYEVEVAKNSMECFKKLKERKPDAIIMDVMMPDGNDGWDTCKKIKKDSGTRDIPVIMFTVRTSDEDKRRSREAGADAHIDKPFFGRDLIETVGDLIKASGS